MQRGNPEHWATGLQKPAVFSGSPEEAPKKEGNTFLVHETQSQVFAGGRQGCGVTIRTVAETGFRWWLGGGEHTGLSSAVTRHYYPSPHPSLYAVSFLRPRTGWNGRNWDCLSVARPDSCRTPSQPLTVPWEKPQRPEGSQGWKKVPLGCVQVAYLQLWDPP